ncbi:MAG: hypothetical protein FWD47_04090 [Treponema sp.]|nr:hypothetical protein [Treponema sp.]
MKRKIIFSIIACLLLFFGGLIYLCFRSPNIILFRWLELINFNYSIFQNIDLKLSSIIIYNFPNALFVLFGYIFIYVIWFKDKYYYFLYTSIITILSIIYEIITKDISDIITIFIAFLISSLLYIKFHGVNYEKKKILGKLYRKHNKNRN